MKKFILLMFCLAPNLASAQTAQKFNLDCKAFEVTLNGTDTWGTPIENEETRAGWLAEQRKMTIDLNQNKFCNLAYCNLSAGDTLENIVKKQKDSLLLSNLEIKEYESNDYNMISSTLVFNQKNNILTHHFIFWDEAGKNQKGNQITNFKCNILPFSLPK